MQKGLTLLTVSMALMAGVLVRRPTVVATGKAVQESARLYFRRDAGAFTLSAKRLQLSVSRLDASVLLSGRERDSLLADLADCRLQYKKIERFLTYFFPNVALTLNGPPVFEGEEPFMEYQEPAGLQMLEMQLTDKTHLPEKERLQQQADLISETAGTLAALTYDFKGSDAEILQSIRMEMIRVSTLGITGYDAPVLKTGLRESVIVCERFREQLAVFRGADALLTAVDKMIRLLQTKQEFDRFDRALFLRSGVIPFQAVLKSFCQANGYTLPAGGLLQKDITDIYAPGALRPATEFSGDAALYALGEKLFSDKSLSRNGTRSCASCHVPARAFTDGLPVSIGLDPRKPLKRNAPSLLYSAYQFRQFWDGRSAGLESQIFTVLHDGLEMGIDTAAVQKKWQLDADDRACIAAAFPGVPGPSPSRLIGQAVGAYINRLGRFNSAFDDYMRGDDKAVDEAVKNGFNLFMGKAKCGSCHFAPVFNGTLPPDFNRTEFEILGTPRDADFSHPVLSSDPGRFAVYPLPFNRSSFKTPTVRNAARTAPYMHNGGLKTLEDVLNFYNNGGGTGMGLDVPGQTLASDSLHLTRQEMKDIIAFIYALNDKPERVKQ